MNIENIIKRLQDVDKMKNVLFDENQRKAFECLPKPGISKIGLSDKSSFLTLDSIVQTKKVRLKKDESIQTLGFLLNGNPINRRMLEMLKPDVRKELEETNKSNCDLQIKKKIYSEIYKKIS